MINMAIFTTRDINNGGGGEEDILNMIECMIDVKFTVFYLDEGKSNIRVNEMKDYFKFIKYKGYKVNFFKILFTSFNFRSLKKFDIVYSYSNEFNVINEISRYAKKLIIGIHTPAMLSYEPINKTFFRRKLFKYYHNLMNFVLTNNYISKNKYFRVQNEYDYNYLLNLGIPVNRIYNIEPFMSLDIDKHNSINDSKILNVLWLHRFSNEKNPKMMIDIASKFEKYNDINFTMNITNEQAKSLGIYIPKNINFIGYVDEDTKRNLLKNNNVFISTSNGETFGMSIAEANNYGLITMSLNVKGLSEHSSYLCGNYEEMINYLDYLRNNKSYVYIKNLEIIDNIYIHTEEKYFKMLKEVIK